MKYKIKPLLLSLCISTLILSILYWTEFHNPIYYFTNDFCIRGYQATSQGTPTRDIFIVNISDFSTKEINDQIYVLSQHNPAVIAVDYFTQDSLGYELTPFKNLVLPIIDSTNSVEYSKNPFTTSAEYGFITVYSSQMFEPFIEISEKKYSSLPSKIIELYDDSLYRLLKERAFQKEIINYSGNISNFPYLGDLTGLKPLDILKEIEGKIVLLGYTGIETPYPTKSDSYDAHDTPKGKMFGVVLLANIVHTMMNNYVTQVPHSVTLSLILVLSLVNIAIAYFLSKRPFHYWLLKLTQVAQIVAAFILISFSLHRFNMYLDYELISFAVIVAPEISFWVFKRTR